MYRNQFCRAFQWTGFYMIGTSVMREIRTFISQSDVFMGKPRDFRVFQSSLGTNRIIEFILRKPFFSCMRLIFAFHVELFFLAIRSFDFLNFLNNFSRTLILSPTSLSNYSCEFYFIHLDLIDTSRSMTPKLR